MGIFDLLSGGETQPKNVFLIGDKREPFPPKDYGYHSFTWGMQNAKGLLDSICKMPEDKGSQRTSLIKRIKEDNSRAEWQLIALNSAIYLAYPQLVLHVHQPHGQRILDGMFDGVDTLKNTNGPILQQYRDVMKHLIIEYYNAIVEDFKNPENPTTLNLNGNQVFKKFEEFICPAYSKFAHTTEDFSAIELVLLQPLIGHQPANLMLALRDNIKIIFK